ncbi:MAG: hypothetical protein LR017_00215 [Candidatus Pacebacteria bacterium]|nr:hypothetical protein [Candidatus Paceibacterota bacterium]
MIDKHQIANFLRINGVASTASDDDIRAALISARWDPRDVEVALLTLHDESVPADVENAAAHQVFNTDSPIASDTLTALLGIDVTLVRSQLKKKAPEGVFGTGHTAGYMIAMVLTPLIIAIVVGVFAMYTLSIGPFYTPVEQFVF